MMLETYALIRAMRAIFSEPPRPCSVRELARKAGMSPSRAKACLDFMHSQGMLRLEKTGRSYQYGVRLDQPLVRQWKVLFALEDLQRAGLAEKVLKGLEGVSSILLYGSLAQGTGDSRSDVDLLVIASTGKRLSFHQLEAALKREINLLVQTPFQWKAKAKADKVFYDRVIHDSIVLHGTKPVVL